ncbi:MAG: hypothetical protein KIS68_13945 [Bauldia sp.]|nr:hypothetical protein [Bauldia sp.]
MSFDVFVQTFENGGAGVADAEVIRALLAPYVRGNETRRLYTTDGTAELFGWDRLSSGFMVNHAGGREIWDVLVRVAKAARPTIMPIGCPVAVTSSDDIAPARTAWQRPRGGERPRLVGLDQ